jgi:hypothetical protein
MGLQVWLPLNGSLDNLGCSDLKFNNIDSTYTKSNTNGKFGLCYQNTSAGSGGIVSNKPINLGKNQSMFCWVNVTAFNAADDLGMGACGQHRYPNNTGMGITAKYISSTAAYLSVNTGNGSSRTFNTYCGKTLLNAGIWYHVGYTYDGNVVRLYVNGVLDGEHTVGVLSVPEDYVQIMCWSFGSGTTTNNTPYGGYKINGCVNDVRMYDHTLSPKEIKEISKGLALHYPLDNNGQGGTNLLTNGNSSATNNNYDLNGYSPGPIMVAGETYTLTICVTPAAGVTNYDAYVSSGYRNLASFAVSGTSKQIITRTFTASYYAGREPSVSSSYATIVLYRFPNNGTVTTNSTIHWAKLEKGSGETIAEWTPHYQANPWGKVISDTSGFRNHGVASVNLITEKGCKHYEDATTFDGSTTWIDVPVKNLMTNILNSQGTISFWCKEGNTGSRSVYFGGYSTGNFNIEMSGSNFRVYWNGSPDRYPTSVENNVWTHWAVTINKSSGFKTYKNGVLVDNYAASLATIPINGNFRIGWDFRNNNNSDGTVMEGAMSDFRIYATELTADDIKLLYQSPISISDNGSVFCKTLREV